MSRSRRKTPIFAHTAARSEASDKRLWHKRRVLPVSASEQLGSPS